nr:MAG TPA: hypothetical protein [Caudoviricetes sp.]DAY18604.1 MAG TPA: hypothetical protein [Caudoviricetes sp.]
MFSQAENCESIEIYSNLKYKIQESSCGLYPNRPCYRPTWIILSALVI